MPKAVTAVLEEDAQAAPVEAEAKPVEKPEEAAPPKPAEPAVETVPAVEEEPPKKVYTDPREALADLDLDELLKDPRVNGKLGELSDKRARELKKHDEDRALREKETEDAKKDQEYLRKLRKTDFDAYNAELDKREASREAIQREAGRARAIATDFTGRLDKWAQEKFPREVLAKFADKTYEGDFIDGVIQYINDLEEGHRDLLRKDIEKELKPAMRKQLLTELNGGESLEPVAGGKGKAKEQDYQTELECAEAFERGDITQQEMLVIYRRHRWR